MFNDTSPTRNVGKDFQKVFNDLRDFRSLLSSEKILNLNVLINFSFPSKKEIQ